MASQELSFNTRRRVALAIANASEKSGVPQNWLVSMAYIESRFDPTAINGSYRGLFQMGRDAWNEAQNAIGPLPPFLRYWVDPFSNALAAAGYVLINQRRLLKAGLEVDEEPRWLYLAHQQGAGGLMDLINVHEGNRWQGVITRSAMLRNTPPGYEKTSDPKSFYQNWMDYLRPYFDKA